MKAATHAVYGGPEENNGSSEIIVRSIKNTTIFIFGSRFPRYPLSLFYRASEAEHTTASDCLASDRRMSQSAFGETVFRKDERNVVINSSELIRAE